MTSARLTPRPIECCALITAVAAGLPSLYLGILTTVASTARPAIPIDATQRRKRNRFVVCVPAHNEETNIANTVEALLTQDYPAADFSVHVVADNCADLTATRAAAAGAQVHVRVDPDRRGKGEALNWLIAQVATDAIDAIVIVDADTIADPKFLSAIDQALDRGAKVAQGYYSVKDPESSEAVGLRFAAIACRHYLRPLARTRLGASSGLYGNGMAFRTEVFLERRWSNHLTEDAEFQMELLLDGIPVTFVPEAVVRAEMPVSLDHATSQNERWELGRLLLVKKYVPLLAQRVMKGGTLPRRAYLDALADHTTPPLTMVAVVDLAAAGLGLMASLRRPGRLSRSAAAIGVTSSLILGAHVFVGLRLVGAPESVYRSLRLVPRAVAWKLMLLVRIGRRPDDVEWLRTSRNEATGGEPW
jgi:cellulose synthase/poly-beta-1,6-N-acetylglucosamine synthase-like glycosyltransferase